MSFTNNTSVENSARQAMTEAQEITERALDRVVSKVKEERIGKIIEEFEANNNHGFDNRKGDELYVDIIAEIKEIKKENMEKSG